MTDFKFITMRQIADSEKYPFTWSAITKLIHRSKDNGLHDAVFRVGRKVLIREDLFDKWLQSRK